MAGSRGWGRGMEFLWEWSVDVGERLGRMRCLGGGRCGLQVFELLTLLGVTLFGGEQFQGTIQCVMFYRNSWRGILGGKR